MLYSFATIMLMVSISLVILTHFSVHSFLKMPMEALDRVVRPYAAGKYDEPIVELPWLEFQSFGKTLARIGETIRVQMEELRRHHDHLEELVKERTAELEDSYADLEKMNKVFIGRELRMTELKEWIRELELQIRAIDTRKGT